MHFFQVPFACLTLKDGNDGKAQPYFDSTIFQRDFDSTIFQRDMEVISEYGLMIQQGFEGNTQFLKPLLYSYVDA